MSTSAAASISSRRTRRCCRSTSHTASRRSATVRAICRSKYSRGGMRSRAARCSVRPCSARDRRSRASNRWKGTLETGSEADVDAAIAKLKALDVDFVKITDSTLKPELFLYAVSKARAAGLRTSGHIPLGITVRQALDAGLSSIEHIDYAVRAGVRDEAAIEAAFAAGSIDRAEASKRLDAGFDPATAKSAYEYFEQKGIAVTPTLNGSRILAWLDRDKHENDEYLAYVGPKL